MVWLTRHAKVVRVTRARDTNGDGRVGAVVVDVGADQHQALQHAERKVRAYGMALFGLASLLCLSVCGNLASSALTILVFKESRTRGATQPVVLSDSRAAAPVGTGLTSYAAEVPAYGKNTPADGWALTGMKRCAVAPSGTEACWELADPTMTDIPGDFLKANTDLTGTLKVGPAVRTIGASAFANTKLAGLDLSEATSLVSIGDSTFLGTDLRGTLVIPNTVTTIGPYAFYHSTKLTGLDLSKATSLVEIGDGAFWDTDLAGTLVIPAKVTTIGNDAFYHSTKLTGLDLSKATSLVSIGDNAFVRTGLTWTSTKFATWDQYVLVRDGHALTPGVSIAWSPTRARGHRTTDEEDDAMRRRDD